MPNFALKSPKNAEFRPKITQKCRISPLKHPKMPIFALKSPKMPNFALKTPNNPRYNRLGTPGAEALAPLFARSSPLAALDLRWNMLGDGGAAALVAAWGGVEWCVAVAGWEWCHSTQRISAVRMVLGRDWEWQWWWHWRCSKLGRKKLGKF
jgi:hypothetical protein